MKIGRENYGEWFIDYFDGKLSKQQVRKLMLFLEVNPDCKAEFDDFEVVSLDAIPVVFPDKNKLRKKEIVAVGAINEQNYEELFVLAHDNELTENEHVTLQKFLSENPKLKKEFVLFTRLHLAKNNSVVYAGKAKLKHQVLVPLIRNFTFAAAAVLLFLIGIRIFMQKPKKVNHHQIVQIHTIKNRAFDSTEITQQEIKTTLLLPSIPFVHRANRPLQNAIALKGSSAIQSLPSRPAYFSLREPLAYFDLRFPKGKVVEERINIAQSLMAENKKMSKVKHGASQPVAQLEGLLAKKEQRRKKNPKKGRGFVKILDSGVTVINSLSNSDPVILVKTFDQNGNLLAYQLIGDQFDIHRRIKRSQ